MAGVTPRLLNEAVDGRPEGAVYIGRGSPLGNPFVVGAGMSRGEAIAAYEGWLARQPELLELAASLRGLDLVCHCWPRQCHGEIIYRLANGHRPPI